MCNLIEGTGRILYDPPRQNMKRKTDWWAIVQVDKEITRYYRWWVKRTYHIDLCQPSWDAHVSIIRGEKPYPDKMDLWKKYNGKIVTFHYEHNVRRSGDTTGNDRPDNFWFVDIHCPELIDIRKEFGFKHDWNLHLTIGKTWY